MPLFEPEKFFLEKYGLTPKDLEGTVYSALGRQINYADLYFEYRCWNDSSGGAVV